MATKWERTYLKIWYFVINSRLYFSYEDYSDDFHTMKISAIDDEGNFTGRLVLVLSITNKKTIPRIEVVWTPEKSFYYDLFEYHMNT